MKTHFFLGKLYPKYSLLYTVFTLVILNAEFGLIWTNPWPDEIELFLKFSKFAIRQIRKIPHENPFFSQASYTNNFFPLQSHYTGDTPCRVWLDLDNSLTRWKIPFSQSSKSSVWNSIFFAWQAIPKIDFAFTVVILLILNTEFGLIWIIPWPYEKELNLNSQIFAIREIRKIPYENPFFPGQTIPKKLFALHCYYTGYTQCRVWFDLDKSLTRWKRIIFKILKYSQFAKFAKFRMKTHFFLGKLYPKNSLLYTVITLVILNAEFGLIWTNPWPDEKELFLKFSKLAIRQIRKIPHENPFFSQASYTNNFFPLQSHYTGDTPCRVWLDLDNSLTRWKIPFSQNSKSSVWNSIFFAWQAIPKIDFAFTVFILLILNTEFGLIWIIPWPYEKELFLKFAKIAIREIREIPYENPTFFVGKLYQFSLLYTLITLVILNTEFGLIWTTPWPNEEEFFLKVSKIRNSRNSRNPSWRPIFS